MGGQCSDWIMTQVGTGDYPYCGARLVLWWGAVGLVYDRHKRGREINQCAGMGML